MDKIVEDCVRVYPLLPFIKMKAAGKGVVEEESDKAKTNPAAFQSSLGYSAGACVGLNFAKIEAKVVLSMILRRFAFTLSPAYIHSPVQEGFAVTPKHGIRVILHKLGEEGSQMSRIVKTVGVVAAVGVAAWGVYKLVGGFVAEEPDQAGKKKMMKNPGRPWELIDANEFRNDPAARKAKFDRTHKLKKAEKCAKGGL